jgi:hypothetical protein
MTEDKVRFQMRISPETDAKIKAAMPLENCQSQNEFVEKALRFYCDYLIAGDCTSVLPPIYLSALRGTIQGTEDRIARLLFKLAVEMNMMMNVLASEVDVSPEALERLRGRCIQEVKKTGGAVTFADAMKYQHSE